MRISTIADLNLLSIPPCLVVIALLVCFFPADIEVEKAKSLGLRKLDVLGVVFSLAGSTLLIYALESASLTQSWSNASTVACLVLAACCWAAFGVWEVYLEDNMTHSFLGAIVPIFPTRLAKKRVIGATLVAGFLNGFAFFAVLVNLPQRYQTVNGQSSVKADLNLIPLLIASAFGAGSTGWVCARYTCDWYVMVAACALQVLSLGLLSTLSTAGVKVQAAELGMKPC